MIDGNLTLHRVLPRNALPNTITDFLWTWRAARRLRAQGEPFDVVLGHQSSTSLGLWSARLRAPLVHLFHASAARELRFLRPRLGRGLRRLTSYPLEALLVAFERTVVRRADRLAVLSEFSRSLLVADHGARGERASILPAGIDVASFSPGDGTAAARASLGLPQEELLVLTVRRLEPRMGLEQLIRALSTVGDGRAPTLAIVGGGSLRDELVRLAREVGVEHRVRFVGRVSDDALRDWYRAADLFVLPTAAYEGFGMVTAEALASGTPVVGTPVGATPELLEPLEPDLVARGSDAAALAAAIKLALGRIGPDLRARCRAYACARYDLSATGGEWESLLLDAAGGAPGGSTDDREAPGAAEAAECASA